MLYLAQVKKRRKWFMGSLVTELTLLAFQHNNSKWIASPEEKTILAPAAKHFGNGTLVTVELDRNYQIQATPELAGSQVARLLQNFSAMAEKSKAQEEQIKEWKQSIDLQVQALNYREIQIETQLQQLKNKEQALRYLRRHPRLQSQTMPSSQLLGQALQQADLVSAAQLKLALKEQIRYPNLRIWEPLALQVANNN
jgi:hypothetical protein